MENSKPKEFEKNNIVTYKKESWVIVDTEKDFVLIRNVMDHTKTIRVKKEDVVPGGGYGNTEEKTPNTASVVVSVVVKDISDLTESERKLVEKITDNTLGEMSDLSYPSA